MNIKASILSITRRPKSVIEVTNGANPGTRAYRRRVSARPYNRVAARYPESPGSRLLPCGTRSVIHASCPSAAPCGRTTACGDRRRANECLENDAARRPRILRRPGARRRCDEAAESIRPLGGDVFRRCKEGAHEATTADLDLLIKDAEKLTERVLALP